MTRHGALFVVCVTCAAACGAPPVLRQSVVFSATTDSELPLQGVQISAAGHPIGMTDASGRLSTEIQGREGEGVSFVAVCPVGFRSPASPGAVRLSRVRSLSTAGGPIVVSVACRAEKRQVALVVLSSGIEDLPVLIDGVPRASTDRDGVAHVVTLAVPDSVLTVALDTSGRKELVPAHLTHSFRIADADQVVVVNETPERRPAPHFSRKRRVYRIE